MSSTAARLSARYGLNHSGSSHAVLTFSQFHYSSHMHVLARASLSHSNLRGDPIHSLTAYISSTDREPQEVLLNWAARMKIAIGAARGLAYLHHDCSPRIIHRDIKSSNILLDDNLDPHVSDFGLAKLLEDKASHVTTIVAGTFGYLAPGRPLFTLCSQCS